ncbi:MAG: hypothetical protein WCS54_00700 [Fibrobacteraceae bacterium]
MNAPHDTNRHNRISAYAFNLADGLGTKSYWQGRMETPKDTISQGAGCTSSPGTTCTSIHGRFRTMKFPRFTANVTRRKK